jgi:peptide/nickel transport system ATP-binding protein
LITHDLSVVSHLADDVAVLYLGEVMEAGTAAEVLGPPYHPYTEALLSSVPVVGGEPRGRRLSGEIPSPIDRPTGCPFHTRCPRSLGARCIEETPSWQRSGTEHIVFCHIPLDELSRVQEPLVEGAT